MIGALRAVLFDLDGTLVQHTHVLLPDQLAEWGHERPADRVDAAFQRQIHWLYAEAKQIEGASLEDLALWEQLLHEAYRRVALELQIQDEAVVSEMIRFFGSEPTPPLFDDVFETLETLLGHELKLGIITQRGRRATLQYLHDHDLHRNFDVLVAGDDGFGRKPAPHPFRRALSVLEVQADQAVYVGDRIDDDCAGALSAGLTPFLIDRGKQSRLADPGSRTAVPEYTPLERLDDLLEHLLGARQRNVTESGS